MNQRTQEIRSLLASVKVRKPASNITPEARYIRELFKGEPFSTDIQKEEEEDEDSSSSEEKVIDVRSQINDLMQARRDRGLPTYVEGPKKGNFLQ